MINCFNLSIMPGPWRFQIARDCDCYGDIVIWIGRVYCSWNWGPVSGAGRPNTG